MMHKSFINKMYYNILQKNIHIRRHIEIRHIYIN